MGNQGDSVCLRVSDSCGDGMSLRSILLSLSVPVQKLMQRLHPPEPKTTYREVMDVLAEMQDGDIVLSREAWHFTNLFIPGFWSHAAIYGNKSVVESVAPVVQLVDAVDWFMRKHNWCVVRFEADPMVGAAAFTNAMREIDLPYDYFFNWTPVGNKAFYCSRLVYYSLRIASMRFANAFTLRRTFGEPTVTPDDFYNACTSGKLRLVHEHRDNK